jgi:hypothetical protein
MFEKIPTRDYQDICPENPYFSKKSENRASACTIIKMLPLYFRLVLVGRENILWYANTMASIVVVALKVVPRSTSIQ